LQKKCAKNKIFTPFNISNAERVIANFTPYHTYLLMGFVGIYLEQHKILILFGIPKTLMGYYKGQTGIFTCIATHISI